MDSEATAGAVILVGLIAMCAAVGYLWGWPFAVLIAGAFLALTGAAMR